MKEIEVAGKKYQLGRLTPMQSFHVTRRIAPLVATMGLSFAALSKGVGMSPESLLPSLAPLATVLSSMTDEQTEYVFGVCLSVVKRGESVKEKTMWQRVMTENGQMQYEDIDMLGMIRLTVGVLQYNLADFLTELIVQTDSTSSSPNTTASAT